MPAADFTAANAVYFQGTSLAAVYLGAQKIWPTAPPVPQLARFTAAEEQLMINCALYYGNNLDDYYYGSTGQQMPEINLKSWQDLQMPSDPGLYAYEVAAIFVVSATTFAMAGHGDPSDSPGADGALQSRYGGRWIMPRNTNVGDAFYVVVGADASDPEAKLAKINIVA